MRSGQPPSVRDVVHAVRPDRLAKTAVLLVGPASVGRLNGEHLDAVLLSLAAFALSSAGMYLTNDIVNRDADARHPSKRSRPIASGRITVRWAIALGVALIAGGLLLGWFAGPEIGGLVGAYVVLNLAYTAALRNQPVIDVLCVSAGKVLRVLAGYAAVEATADLAMLLTVLLGSLFLIVTLRATEWRETGGGASATRPTTGFYTPIRAGAIRDIAGAACTGAFAVWAAERATEPQHAVAGLCALAALVAGLLVVRARSRADRVPTDAFRTYGGAVSGGFAVAWFVAVTLAA